MFLIINLDEVVKVPAAILHYKKYGWLKNITRENEAQLIKFEDNEVKVI